MKLINEVAKKLNITSRSIRFYEEKGLISPVNHLTTSTDFSDYDMIRIQWIIMLRDLGMTITDIKELLNTIDVAPYDEREKILFYLEVQRDLITQKQHENRDISKIIDKMVDQIRNNYAIVYKDEFLKLTQKIKDIREVREGRKVMYSLNTYIENFSKTVKAGKGDYDLHFNYKKVLDKVVKKISPKAGEKGFDVGCGTGTLANILINMGVKMSGIDISYDMVDQCRKNNPLMNVKLSNYMAIPFDDKQFDFVVSTFSFRHLTKEQEIIVFEEINRILKENGRICISDIMFDHEDEKLAYLRMLKENSLIDQYERCKAYTFSSKSRIEAWLRQHSFTVSTEKIAQSQYVIYGEK